MNFPRIVLGPQRLLPTVGRELASLDVDGPVAAITAGWQERESEDDELQNACGRPIENLRLYARWEELQRDDKELALAHRERQDELRRLRDLYRMRLEAEKKVVLRLFLDDGPARLLDPEREAAIDALRRLDAHHLARIRAIRADFDARLTPSERPAVQRHTRELTEQIHAAGAVLIAGGHVAILLNRLQVFGLETILDQKPIIAWSAGAMAISDRVLLFHDDPPQGAGHAEVFEEGLGLLPGLAVFPHARHRLRLQDPTRVAMLARRFAPSVCVALDEGDRLGAPDAVPGSPPRARRLCVDGRVEPLGTSADREDLTFPVDKALQVAPAWTYEELPVIQEET
jgi:hypothetical protein